VSEQQKTTRLAGFGASFAGTVRGAGDDKPGPVRRLLTLTGTTVVVAAVVLGAGYLINRGAGQPGDRHSAAAVPSARAGSGLVGGTPSSNASTADAGRAVTNHDPAASGTGAGNDPSHQPAPTTPAGGQPTGPAGKPAGNDGGGSSSSGKTHVTARVGSDTSSIVSNSSGLCLDVTDGGGTGTPLQVWDCAGNAQQAWTFTAGTVRNRGLCIDITNGSQSDGATLRVATCNGGWAQKWTVNSGNDLANTVIGKCADLKDQGTSNGTRVQLWQCVGGDNQKFHLG